MNHNNSSDGSLRDLWLGIAISLGAYLVGSSVLGIVLGPLALLVTIIAHIAAIIICFKKGMKRMAQGLLIGLGIFILLIGACFGLLFVMLGG